MEHPGLEQGRAWLQARGIQSEALLLFGAFGAKGTSVVLEKIDDSLTIRKPLTSKVRGLHAPTTKALDKNPRRVDRGRIFAAFWPT